MSAGARRLLCGNGSNNGGGGKEQAAFNTSHKLLSNFSHISKQPVLMSLTSFLHLQNLKSESGVVWGRFEEAGERMWVWQMDQGQADGWRKARRPACPQGQCH